MRALRSKGSSFLPPEELSSDRTFQGAGSGARASCEVNCSRIFA